MKKYIVSDPHILFGTPVVKGTRIPIEMITSLLKQGYTLDQIHEMYNWVDKKTLEGVIDEITELVTTTFHAKRISQT